MTTQWNPKALDDDDPPEPIPWDPPDWAFRPDDDPPARPAPNIDTIRSRLSAPAWERALEALLEVEREANYDDSLEP